MTLTFEKTGSTETSWVFGIPTCTDYWIHAETPEEGEFCADEAIRYLTECLKEDPPPQSYPVRFEKVNTIQLSVSLQYAHRQATQLARMLGHFRNMNTAVLREKLEAQRAEAARVEEETRLAEEKAARQAAAKASEKTTINVDFFVAPTPKPKAKPKAKTSPKVSAVKPKPAPKPKAKPVAVDDPRSLFGSFALTQ